MKKYQITKSEILGTHLIEEYKRMAQEISFTDQIKSTYKVVPKPDIAPITKITKIEYAMYYYYQIKAEVRAQMGYEAGENGKEDALKKIAQLHGFAYKAFQQSFNEIHNHKSSDWITGTKQNLRNFKRVIEMLAEYPKAQTLAQNDLKQAEINGDKRGNPIT